MIRAFDWRDFPRLHKYRKQGFWLDNELALTQNTLIVPLGALFASLGPATGVFTFIARESDKPAVIGQFHHTTSTPHAHISFIAPRRAAHSPQIPALLDHFMEQCGRRGVQYLLAEVEEGAEIFEVLRKTGFSIFTRQSVWRIPSKPTVSGLETRWRPAIEQDQFDIRTLYSGTVPALVQQAEPPPWERLGGYVYKQEDELHAFVQLAVGPRGILAKLIVHPDIDHPAERLAELFSHLPYHSQSPVYVVIRSHQGWLPQVLTAMGAEEGLSQALMVRRLAVTSKVNLTIKVPTVGMDTAQPNISTTAMQNGEPS